MPPWLAPAIGLLSAIVGAGRALWPHRAPDPPALTLTGPTSITGGVAGGNVGTASVTPAAAGGDAPVLNIGSVTTSGPGTGVVGVDRRSYHEGGKC